MLATPRRTFRVVSFVGTRASLPVRRQCATAALLNRGGPTCVSSLPLLPPFTVSAAPCRCYSSVVRGESMTAEEDAKPVDGELADDELDAYESLLLNADDTAPLAQEGEEDTAGGEVADVHDAASLLESEDARLADEALALLPPDGRPVRLTALSPSLDLARVSDVYGSVLQMLQRHPKLFTCTQEKEGGEGEPLRWYVRRRRVESTACGPAYATGEAADRERLPTADDMTDLCLAEALRAAGIGAGPARVGDALPLRGTRERTERRRVALSPTPEGVSALSRSDWAALAAALPEKGCARVQAVRASASLPPALVTAMASSGKGLLRLFHEQYDEAAAFVEVSLDGVHMARRGGLGRTTATWTPTAARVDGPPSEDGGWFGDLDLDGTGVAVEGVEERGPGREEESEAVTEGEGGTPVFYSGLDGDAAPLLFRPRAPTTPRREKRSQPPPPLRPATPTTPSPARTANPPPTRKAQRTHDELMAAHAALAERRGWRSPAEMLSLLVECVPTFYVPIAALVPSDSLAKVLGPRNSMSHVVRVYSYFCEWDRASDHVRLRPGVLHPHCGKANRHYAAFDGSSSFATVVDEAAGERQGAGNGQSRGSPPPSTGTILQSSNATRAFPVLRPIIKSDIDVGAGGMRSGRVREEATLGSAGRPLVVTDGAPDVWGSGRTAAARALQAGLPDNPFSLLPSLQPAQQFSPANLPPSAILLFSLMSCLNEETDVPVADLAASLSERLRPACTAADVEAALRQLDSGDVPDSPSADPLAAFVRWARACELLLFTGDALGPLRVRLRPFWLSPSARGELNFAALPAPCVKLLQPLWRPLSTLLAAPTAGGRLPVEAREELLLRARTVPLQDGRQDAEACLVAYLQLCGRCVWVDVKGARVRRFTATADLDDLTHAAIPCLARFASPTDYESLSAVAARAALGMQSASGMTAQEPSGCQEGSGLLSMLLRGDPVQARAFLKAHPKELETRTTNGGDLYIKRRTRFAAFGKSS